MTKDGKILYPKGHAELNKTQNNLIETHVTALFVYKSKYFMHRQILCK